MARVQIGLEKLLAHDIAKFSGARAGLLANQSSVDASLRHAVDLLSECGKIELVRLFAPEHGFRGELQDMAAVEDTVDPCTKLPVVSLYGKSEKSLSPAKEQLQDLDVLFVDLPDIGSRYYTFAQSLGYCLKTALTAGTKVVVLDRPNPINGVDLEGARLLSSCRSFCGYAPVANRHGLTLGELALIMNKGFGEHDTQIPAANCDLEVITVEGWQRDAYYEQSGLPWVMPSPNMPTVDTAFIYPGTCLFEATTVSEGRGTTRPFELLGAPYIDGTAWVREALKLNIGLDGAALRPVSFVPKFNKWANVSCGGLQIHVLDRNKCKPLRLAIALLYTLARLYPDEFSLRAAAYEFVDKVPALDLLFGNASLRHCLFSGAELYDVLAELSSFEQWYRQTRAEFLLY
jgi:uncharacterized protein YbbC (DUF1343 family)